MRGRRTLAPCVAVALALLLPITGIRAQANNGALDLLLPIGARSTAMGGAAVAERGSEAIWWNPAGIAAMTKPELALDHFETFVVSGGDAASLILPLHNIGVLGLSARLFNYGDEATTDTSGADIGVLGNRSYAIGATFAAAFGPRVNAGVSFRLYQSAATCSGPCPASLVTGDFSTSAVDIGVQLQPSATQPLWLGAALTNVGPKLQVHDQPQADALPTRIRLGASYAPTSASWDPRLRVLATGELVTTTSFGSPEVRVGAEAGYLSGKTLLLVRGGFAAQSSSGESNMQPSVGIGLASGRVKLDLTRVFESLSTGLGKPPTYISIRVGL